MRRKDREITDQDKIREILHSSHCCRIGLADEGQVYIVPLNFGYQWDNQLPVLYFHCAREGRKLDMISQNPQVGFEMNTNYQFHEGALACECSAAFQSIIGSGIIRVVTDPAEKTEGLTAIMNHYTSGKAWEFNRHMLDSVCVLKLQVTELSCKIHL